MSRLPPRSFFRDLEHDRDILMDEDDEIRLMALEEEEAYEDAMYDRIAALGPPRKFNAAFWLKADRMTQTEASLRLAISLLQRRVVASDVVVALTGGELTRAVKPRFPVVAFLRSLGFTAPEDAADWRDRYSSSRADFGLVLHNRLGEGDVLAMLPSGSRFAAEVTGGPLKPTRSPTEHRLLRAVIARAVTSEYSAPSDVLVAVVPRSERFRALGRQWGELPRLVQTGVSIAFVDRTGTVRGCPAIDSA